ncbi:ABC-type transport auxiliary lipoprotein family protein [Pandoraea apista]|uniref:ABC-type transport auxiliary lipoprotein family protein n=1 Tax=Pandoraea apista TaxID=93218 RepID=UPI0013A53D4C|nr:ABC-type transport auxiliary lipoprotein family protein [Pandoraea apista]
MTEPTGAIRTNEATAAMALRASGARRVRPLTTWLLCAGAAVLMAGCATSTSPGSLMRFDLGPPTVPAAASAASTTANAVDTAAPAAGVTAAGAPRMSPLKVVVNAPSWLDADVIYYRLPASEGDQARVYANSRWLASPARLFGDRLRSALSVDRPVLAAGDPTAAPALRVELEEFAQYFDSTSSSHGVVQVRATLFDGPKLLAQTTLRAQAPAPSADAAGGARALALASDAVQTQLIQWLAGRVPAPSATTRAPAQSRALPAASSASGAAAPAR